MNRIVVVGSLNMDLVITTPRVPAMGETIIGSGFMTAPGGKGANQAVAAARLGGQVSMVGCVGDDIFGRDLLDNLKRNGVDTGHVRMCQGVSTGIAVITVKDGDNSIILDSGANFRLSEEDINSAEALIKSSDVMLVQLEIPLEAVARAVELAARHGVKVILNPAPARPLPDEILKHVDFITPNESEAEILTGIKIEGRESISKAAAFLRNRGVKQVVITLGKKGAAYNQGDEMLYKGVPEVKVVDTTAAGDSFNGALAVKISQGGEVGASMDFCNTVGMLTVMKKGAQASLPYLEEALREMDRLTEAKSGT